jgi:hypothetical protein
VCGEGRGGLFIVDPDVAKLLTVVALLNTYLGSVCLNLDNDVAEIIQFEFFQ